MKPSRISRFSPANQVIGTLKGQSHGMGDLLSSITTGVSNDVNNAPTQLLNGLIGSVVAQPGVQAAGAAQLKQQSASALATQITNILNNPTELALYAGGTLLLLVVIAKVMK